MANYQNLKAAISAAIRTNGNQEITGQVLQDVLNSIVSVIGANYTFAGVATPATNPGTPDQNVIYLAMEGGTYTNFNGTVLPAGISLLMWNGSWTSETVMYGDGGVFDISVYKSSGGTLATFADLSAALDGGNNIPASARKGGMSVKFVQSSDNKYVQYRLKSQSFDTNINNWTICTDVVEVYNPEYIEAKTDANNKLFEATKINGTKYFGADIEVEGIIINPGVQEPLSYLNPIDNPEWGKVVTDERGKVLGGRDKKGRVKEYVGLDVNKLNADTANINSLHLSENGLAELVEDLEEHGIAADGVTQEELNQQLSEYSKTTVTDSRYAAKSLESTVGTLSSELSSTEDTVTNIERDIDTINDALSGLTSPLPSGAIAGNNVWTGTNQFTQAIISVAGSNDNNVALYGQFKNTLHRFVDAADYGFDSTNSGSDNATALQSAVNGGNKTVVISKPGEYLIGNTVLLDDNTTLMCGKGVVLKKSSTSFVHILLNRGANVREVNKNISIIGGTYCINNNDALHDSDLDTPLWGLRGLISFVCVENLIIDNISIPDLLTAEYGIHINSFNRICIKNSYIKGNKDGIHISDGEHFTISHCYIDTNDDPIAMNASDWCTSNCVDGTLKYGLIEDCITKGSGRYLFNIGAIVDWHSGMDICRGDRVVNNGYVYKAILSLGDPVTQSQTEPTINTFTGYQEDAGGFKWKLMRKTSFYTTNVENVTIRNCHSYTNRIMEGCSSTETYWGRELYPEVPVANYPHVSFKVEDCVFDTLFMNYNDKVNDDIVFERTVIPKRIGMLGKINGVSGKTVLRDCDFSTIQDANDITMPQNLHLIVDDARGVDYLKFEDNKAEGRLETNFPCNVTSFTGTQKKGDIVKIQDGTPKIFNGSSWIALI